MTNSPYMRIFFTTALTCSYFLHCQYADFQNLSPSSHSTFLTASTKSQNQHRLTPTVADNPKLNNLVDCDTYAICGARFSVINAQSLV